MPSRLSFQVVVQWCAISFRSQRPASTNRCKYVACDFSESPHLIERRPLAMALGNDDKKPTADDLDWGEVKRLSRLMPEQRPMQPRGRKLL